MVNGEISMWVNVNTLDVYQHRFQLKEAFPSTSFPAHLTESVLAPLGVLPLVPTNPPEPVIGQKLVNGRPQYFEGAWRQTWELVEVTSEESALQEALVRQSAVEGILLERAARLAAGFDYDFGDERGIHRIGTTEEDHRGWEYVDRWAAAQTALGNHSATLTITTDTGPTFVTPQEWYQIVAHGAVVQQPIWQASFALQAMDPIPEDFTENSWWGGDITSGHVQAPEETP